MWDEISFVYRKVAASFNLIGYYHYRDIRILLSPKSLLLLATMVHVSLNEVRTRDKRIQFDQNDENCTEYEIKFFYVDLPHS
jgi:hypothetical protein